MKHWRGAGLLLLATLLVGPLLWLAASAAGQLLPALGQVFTARKLLLLARSVGFSLTVCVFTMLLAFVVAYGFYTHRAPAVLFPGLLLMMVFVPPYIHAQSFIFLFDQLFAGTRVNFNGFWAAGLSMAFALLPIPCVLLYECMCAIPPALLDAARLYRRPSAAFFRVFLPLSFKGIWGGMAVVFVLCFSEFTVPSIFGMNTYALDLFAEYSTTHSAARVFFHALPVLFFCLLFALPAARAIRGLVLHPPRRGRTMAKTPVGGAYILACLVLAVAVLLPLANLFAKWGGPALFAQNLGSSLGEAGSSLVIAALTLVAALPIAFLGGVLIAQRSRGISFAAVFVCLLPITMPTGLWGVACVSLLRVLGLTNTLAAPVLAGALRMAPFGALVIAGTLAGLDPNLLGAWRLLHKGRAGGLWRVLFALVRPGVLGAAALIFAFTLADVGTILLTVPAGMNTLTIKIYNYLHYGASDVVASLCLAMLAVTVAVGAPAVHLVSRQRR